ncbi:MAG TPA: DMT family transporter [Anaerolineales bacterium]|nr:DMT family transporter [Anaerolineales bacterium]
MSNLGEVAALLTAMCYSISSIFFTRAGQKYGPMTSNRLRLVVAIVLLGMIHWIAYGSPVPIHAGIQRWLWLGISGVVGLAIGDLFLFQAYVIIGPRLGLLFLSLSPALATILAWLFLGERLSLGKLLGITITLLGIAWVVLESNINHDSPANQALPAVRKVNMKGIIAGLIAATGQALGVVLAKPGLADNFPPISGNVIRMSTAFLSIWLVTLFQGQVIHTFQQANQQRSGLVYILAGAVFGPLIGVSLSLFAVQNTNVGIASTLIALPPIFLLPVGRFIFKENISWRAVLGTVIAVVGVGLLFWL